jgi:hypothetical protein
MQNDESGTVKPCSGFATRVTAIGFQIFRAVGTGGVPEREVVTDRAMETWYHSSIA